MAQVSRGALHQRNSKAVDVQVTVVGLTRLSASFALALGEFSNKPNAPVIFNIAGYDTQQEQVKRAQEMGAIQTAYKNLSDAVGKADIILLDIPLGKQEAIFSEMGGSLKLGAVVLDFAPVKRLGEKLAHTYFPKGHDGTLDAYLVGVTPLIRMGKLYQADELSNASADLFKGTDLVIVPSARIPADAVKVANDLADFLEMSPRFMDPLEYDGLTGMVEGMPALQSLLFIQSIQQSAGRTDLLRLANTRFANSLQNMRGASAADLSTLLQANRDNILHHIEQMAVALESLREVMMDKDPLLLETFVQQAIDSFEEWEIRRRDNRWEEDFSAHTADVHISSMGGLMNNVFNIRRKKDDDKK